MKQTIGNEIRRIIAERKAVRSPFYFATSIEVSNRTGIPVSQVEKIARDIPGIKIGKTLNYEHYSFPS